MDEALWLPTEKSVQVALRTQQIIGYESGVADMIDPLAGSYMLEYLTDEIEKKAVEYLEKIDEMGGALKAIENGYIQGEIQNAAFGAQRRLENREDIVVGVNKFTVDEKIELESLKLDPRIESEQRDRLAALRAGRDKVLVEALLERLENAAEGDENLMPIIIECVENKLTLGEICNRLRKVWGEYRAPTFI
jgi:methylmalonyl-CoA mutase N-terminal domain/subunit